MKYLLLVFVTCVFIVIADVEASAPRQQGDTHNLSVLLRSCARCHAPPGTNSRLFDDKLQIIWGTMDHAAIRRNIITVSGWRFSTPPRTTPDEFDQLMRALELLDKRK